MRVALIIALLVIVVWQSMQIIRLEQFHYATVQGFCGHVNFNDPVSVRTYNECLTKSTTKANPIFHLYTGLTEPLTSK